MFEPDIMLCRLCRKSSGPYVDIFNPKGTRGLIVWKVIKDLIQLDVSKDDMLPNAICEMCMDKVVDFRNFKSMCINSRIEFLKASASVGLVELESDNQPTILPERNVLTPSMTVDSTSACVIQGRQVWSRESVMSPVVEQTTAQYSNVVFCVAGSSQDEDNRELLNVIGDSGLPFQPAEMVENTMLSSNRPLAEVTMEPSTVQRVQYGEISGQLIKRDSTSVTPQKEQDVTSQYLERRLDEGIGDLKSCDAPNCRKVFSTYKALVVHKKTKHSDLCDKIDNHVERMSGGSDGSRSTVPSNVVHNREKETSICIAKFPCTHPSCKRVFSSLSSLLNHQATHTQRDDCNRLGNGVNSSESSGEVVLLSGDSDGNSRSSLINDDYMEDVQGGETTPPIRDNCDSLSEPVAVVDTADSSIPGEPEFLCHWSGCGKAFHSFNKLLQHRKRKHCTDKGVRGPVKPPKKSRPTKLSRELTALLKGSSKFYPCTWPGCSETFRAERSLKNHMTRSHGVGGKNKAKRKRNSPKSSKFVDVAHSDGTEDGREGDPDVPNSNVTGEEVKIKKEPMLEENCEGSGCEKSAPEGQSSTTYEGDRDDDSFECEYPDCLRVFKNFIALQAHFSRMHYAGNTSGKPRRSKGGRR